MTQTANNQSFHQHVENHSEFMMTSHEQTTAPNKRHWPNNADEFPQKNDTDVNMILFGKSAQMSMNQIHPSKRSCMMTSYMEPTNTADDHQWIMDCQQSSSYDFMSSDNHIDSDVDKRAWNGGNTDPSNNIVMNGLTCDNNSENMLMNELEHKKQCYNTMSVKTNDLERDLLGLSTHSSASTSNANSVLIHMQPNHLNDSVYQTSASSLNTNDNNTSQANANAANSIAPRYIIIITIIQFEIIFYPIVSYFLSI